MPTVRRLLAAIAVALFAGSAPAADKRVLLVTHSGGFVHQSVGTAEDVLKEIAAKEKLAVTCWRFTGDPAGGALEKYGKRFREATGKTVEPENCGRINAGTLKNFDLVLFFTTGDPVNASELKDLLAWVKAGGAFAGTHCATDTLYKNPEYGDMIGAYFRGHPSGLQDIQIRVEDPKHPAATFAEGAPYKDEMYIFRDQPYSRDKLRVILSAGGLKPGRNLARPDGDYAVSWCKEYGAGKVFYTSFGHRNEVWKDPAFQAHLLGGLRWATGEAAGDATPTGAKK